MRAGLNNSMVRTAVVLSFGVAMTAMAQTAPQQPRRIVLPLPKAALTETASAQPMANPMYAAATTPATTTPTTPAGGDAGTEVTPNMEAARAAVAALNRAAAMSAAVPTTTTTSKAQSSAPASNNVPVYSAPGDSIPVYNVAAIVQPAAPAPTPAPVAAPAPTPVAPAVGYETGTTGYAGRGGAGMLRNFDSTEAAEQSLHVAVGHSIFVDTKHRLTRVYVTDPTILNSYTSSPNQIVVTALKAGSSTVMVWDESGETQAYLVSADTNFAPLQQALKMAFPADSIQVQANEDRALLTGYAGSQLDLDAATKLALQFTKNVSNSIVLNSSRVKQVRLKVQIVEVDRSKLAQFGINLFANGGKNIGSGSTSAYPSSINKTTTGGTSTVTVTNPLNFSYFNNQYNVGVTIQDLANMNVLQILAEPTITTMSGVKASFLAGGEFPFPVVQSGSGGSAPTVTVEFRQFGVKLDFTPRVNPDGTVDLKVTPEVSALDYADAVSIAGYTIPALSTRRADTQMVLQDGQSFAISGLLDQRTTDALGKTPGISSIPIIGELFKNRAFDSSKRELVIFVTPRIVNPDSDKIRTIIDDVASCSSRRTRAARWMSWW
ncbi:MAG: pilus assembly protein N-terminal domain-containing protein [Acidobacteriota bacterium]